MGTPFAERATKAPHRHHAFDNRKGGARGSTKSTPFPSRAISGDATHLFALCDYYDPMRRGRKNLHGFRLMNTTDTNTAEREEFCDDDCRHEYANKIRDGELTTDGYGFERGRCEFCGVPLDWARPLLAAYLDEMCKKSNTPRLKEDEGKKFAYLHKGMLAIFKMQDEGASSGEICLKLGILQNSTGWRYIDMWNAINTIEGKGS